MKSSKRRGGFTSEDKKYCSGCDYFKWTRSGSHTCDYLLMTGKRRQLVCPPGVGCVLHTQRQGPERAGF